MKILLAYPPDYSLRGEKNTEFPNSLNYISSAILKDNEVKILVPDILNSKDIWKTIKEIVKDIKPDLTGVSITSPNYSSSVKMIKLIKESYPETLIVVGGPHPTALPIKVMGEVEEIDFLIYGEGEKSIRYLVEELKKKHPVFKNIKGLVYRSNKRIIKNSPDELINNLDEIEFPEKDNIIGKSSLPSHEFGQMMLTRGCPFRCIFCGAHIVCGKKIRSRSPENVLSEIKGIMKKYGTDRFIFKDSTFTLNKDLINDLLDFFIKSNISIKWGCNTRVDMINEDLLKKMKSAGCEFISYGAESGDNETLIKLSKGIKIEQVEEAINLTKKYGMETICYFMIGFPWENKKMMEDSVKKALSINVDRIVLSSALPLPLTELENLSKKIDWLKFDSKTYVDGSINLTKFRDEEYEELYNSLSRKVNFYNKKKKIFNKIKYIKMELLKGNFKVITQELKRRKWFH